MKTNNIILYALFLLFFFLNIRTLYSATQNTAHQLKKEIQYRQSKEILRSWIEADNRSVRWTLYKISDTGQYEIHSQNIIYPCKRIVIKESSKFSKIRYYDLESSRYFRLKAGSIIYVVEQIEGGIDKQNHSTYPVNLILIENDNSHVAIYLNDTGYKKDYQLLTKLIHQSHNYRIL